MLGGRLPQRQATVTVAGEQQGAGDRRDDRAPGERLQRRKTHRVPSLQRLNLDPDSAACYPYTAEAERFFCSAEPPAHRRSSKRDARWQINAATLRNARESVAPSASARRLAADTENTLFQLMRCAMDLAATCAALLHLMGMGRHDEGAGAEHDPADMGTAYGLEVSLAPAPGAASSGESDAGFQVSEQNSWLWPH
jgi:hypothetical protein